MVQAAADQLRILPYYAGTVATPPYIHLATKLASGAGMPKVYISNSGSEANEKAFKMSRLFGVSENKQGKMTNRMSRPDQSWQKNSVVRYGRRQKNARMGYALPGWIAGNFTLAAIAVRSAKNIPIAKSTAPGLWRPPSRKKIRTPWPPSSLEPITAGGGIIPPVPEYFPIIQEICKKHEVLLIIDEVVAGFGRTGKITRPLTL